MKIWMTALAILLVVTSSVMTSGQTAAQGNSVAVDQIAPQLQQSIQAAASDAMISVIVELKDQEDLRPIKDKERRKRLRKVIDRLQQKSNLTQKRIQRLLGQRAGQGQVASFKSYWIFNGLEVTATAAVIQELAALAEVAKITANEAVQAPMLPVSGNPAEANLILVNAPALWNLGWQGQGIVVANMDTGVDVNHADLAAKWRGGPNSWFDPYGQHPNSPVDPSGHGTWTMGVMVGGDAGGTSIGMAPASQWIAVKIFNDQGSGTVAGIHAGFQWLLDPDGNPTTDDAPQVVNNSWTFQTPSCNLEFAPDLQALRTAGILPIFAAGNGGPAAGSSYSPANNPGAFAVGGVDNNDLLYANSSRGPTTCNGQATFPQLVAPGVDIRSSERFNLYANATGTSLAAPHVSGALALLLSAFPDLTTTEQEAALLSSAVDLGAPGADNVFGYGRLDVFGAYQLLNATTTNQPPTVDAGVDQTIPLLATAQLNGTATDDGLPTPANLVTTWSLVSGPGAVTFGNVNALNTTADFGVDGVYTLRLTADDGALSASDDLVITVNPAPPTNQAPTVNAGVDQTITLSAAATLSGSASDDGLPTPANLVTTWSLVSGPGAVTFGNVNALNTAAAFDGAGVYTLRLTADDGALSASDDLVISVDPAPPTNQAPIVNAGADQAITLPAGATLSGSASDDGLPTPANLVTTWSLVSGPGAVTFGNINALNTAAAFGGAGVYTLRLTADDGALSASDELVITVDPAPPTNQAPIVNAGADQTITLPVAATLSGSASDDGLPTPANLVTTWSLVSGPGTVTFGNINALNTAAAFNGAGVYTLRLTADDGALSASDELVVTVSPPTSVNGPIYLSSSTNGNVGGVAFADEDILAYDPTTDSWSLAFDGSDVGLGGVDINAFVLLSDGSLLLSTDNPVTINGVGSVDDSDILHFIPTALGDLTAGRYELYFRGADVGLSTSGEDIDAIDFAPDGRLLISTLNGVSVPGLSGADEDILAFAPTTLGNPTSGSWSLYFDGSTAELTDATEEIWGLSIDAGGKLYLSTQGAFAVTGASGSAADIFTCTPISLGANNTSCTYAPYWTGAAHGFGAEVIDGMNIGGSLSVSGGPANQSPTVNSGADQTITLPAGATLSGSASDDGLPNPANLVTTWSLVSGPGAVTFGNINALNTTANFAVTGVYTLRLTADDGALSASDELVITVDPAPPTNQAPTVNAGVDQAITLPAAATLSGSASDDGLPTPANLVTTWSVVSGPGAVTFGNVNALNTAAAFDGAGVYTLRLTADDGSLTASADVVITANAQSASGDIIYLSSSSNGNVVGVAFRDEDILAYNPNTDSWSLLFDGSDVGLGGVDVDAFVLLSDGSLLLSTDNPVTISGIGSVDDSDILHFIPSSLGATTAGSYEFYLRGADWGLSTTSEDIDAIALLPDGRLLFSTLGNVNMQGVSGADEDLIALDLNTGAASLYFDGSNVGLTDSAEDIWGAWLDGTGKLYLTTLGTFSVNGVSGSGSDIFICALLATGLNSTSCTFGSYWQGATYGFSGVADGFAIGGALPLFSASGQVNAAEALDNDQSNPDDDPLNGEVEADEAESTAEEELTQTIFLPLINR